jgi:hypothetical protein
MQIAAIIYITLAAVIVIVMFVRSKAKEAAPIFKLTENDKADLREIRRDFSARKLFARLLGGFASLCFISGALSIFHRNASGQVDWFAAIELVILGQILLLFAVLLFRSAN